MQEMHSDWALSAWLGHTEVKASTTGCFDKIVNRDEKKQPPAVEDNTEPSETENLQDEQQSDEDDTATENP